MSKHKPYENNNKFLITERSLNYILRPVQVRSQNYPYTYSIENLDETVSVTVDRAWTPYNHLVLDFIGHELHSKAYKNIHKLRDSWKNEASQDLLMQTGQLLRYSDRETIINEELKPMIPKYKRHEQLTELCNEWQELQIQSKLNEEKLEVLKKFQQEKYELQRELHIYLNDLHEVRDLIFGDVIGPAEVNFKISALLQSYAKFFKKRRKEYFKKLLRKTSAVRFTFEYPIRVPVIENKVKNGEQQTEIKDVTPKIIKIKNDKFFNLKIDGDNVRVIFNSFLGRAYVHNVLTLNTDWFEEGFLNLDGYASAIYRRFFVIRSGNKFDRIPIKDLVDYFGFMKNSYYPAVVEKAFGDIKNAGLIQDYKVVANGGKFSKGYIEIEKSSK
jgi:hypothetical protein